MWDNVTTLPETDLMAAAIDTAALQLNRRLSRLKRRPDDYRLWVEAERLQEALEREALSLSVKPEGDPIVNAIAERHGAGFERLGFLRELSIAMNDRLCGRSDMTPSRGTRARAVVEVHADACLTAGEISVLLAAGYPSGAVARWRSLHEAHVITAYLTKQPATIAERFLAHRWVVAAQLMDPDGERSESTDAASSRRVIARFGPEMKNDYGWASPRLKGKPRKPSFTDLERSVTLGRGRRAVANKLIHPGSLSAVFRTAVPGAPGVHLVGPRPDGIGEAGVLTAMSLSAISALLPQLVFDDPTVAQIWSEAVLLIGDDAMESFIRSAES